MQGWGECKNSSDSWKTLFYRNECIDTYVAVCILFYCCNLQQGLLGIAGRDSLFMHGETTRRLDETENKDNFLKKSRQTENKDE